MELLTGAEALQWLAARGVGMGPLKAVSGNAFLANSAFGDLPAAKTTPVARGLAEWLCEFRPDRALVLITETGVWPSSENLRLYELLRRAHGHAGWSADAEPGHLFHGNQRDDLMTLIEIALISGWDITAASEDGTRAFSFDHDGRFACRAESQASADAGLKAVN